MSTNLSDESFADEHHMRDEYDFRGGVRGKHSRAYRQGYTVTIHHGDGTTTVQEFKPEEGAIVLDPDVRVYFPDAEVVNRTLRTLITLLPGRDVPAS